MKKTIYTTVFAITLILLGFEQVKAQEKVEKNYYSGTVAGAKVKMYLKSVYNPEVNLASYEGWYYYLSSGKANKIKLTGEWDGRVIRLSVKDTQGNSLESFMLATGYSGYDLEGEWWQKTKENTKPVKLKKIDNPNNKFTTYISKNKGVTEYLYTTYPLEFFYSSSKNPQKIELKSVGGDMMTQIYKVSFPNDSKVYVLKIEGNKIECTNPDGTKQTFTKQ